MFHWGQGPAPGILLESPENPAERERERDRQTDRQTKREEKVP